MPWYHAFAAAVRLVLMAILAIYLWRSDEWWLNGVLRSGIVLYFAANAFTLGDSLTIAKLIGVPEERVLRLRFAAIFMALLLACVGALITHSPVGYLAAACFLFMSLAYWWVLRSVFRPYTRSGP